MQIAKSADATEVGGDVIGGVIGGGGCGLGAASPSPALGYVLLTLAAAKRRSRQS